MGAKIPQGVSGIPRDVQIRENRKPATGAEKEDGVKQTGAPTDSREKTPDKNEAQRTVCEAPMKPSAGMVPPKCGGALRAKQPKDVKKGKPISLMDRLKKVKVPDANVMDQNGANVFAQTAVTRFLGQEDVRDLYAAEAPRVLEERRRREEATEKKKAQSRPGPFGSEHAVVRDQKAKVTLVWHSSGPYDAHYYAGEHALSGFPQNVRDSVHRCQAAIDQAAFQGARFASLHLMHGQDSNGNSLELTQKGTKQAVSKWLVFTKKEAMKHVKKAEEADRKGDVKAADAEYHEALKYAGLAFHSIEDATSPAHCTAVRNSKGRYDRTLLPWQEGTYKYGPTSILHGEAERFVPPQNSHLFRASSAFLREFFNKDKPATDEAMADFLSRYGVDQKDGTETRSSVVPPPRARVH